MVEVAAAGSEARRRHWAAIGRFAHLLEDGREGVRLPPNTALMAVSGVVGLMFDYLQAGRPAELLRLPPQLEFALLVPFVSPRAATEVSRRDGRYSQSP